MNDWSNLNHLQLGKYGEYLAKMEFTKAGFDVYTAEVDDKGIDFIVRKNENEYYDVQVKSIRIDTHYIFMKKKCFSPRTNLLLALILFENNSEPKLLLIPSLEWKNKNHSFFVDRDYIDKKSDPEWGLNITKSSKQLLESTYMFSERLKYFKCK